MNNTGSRFGERVNLKRDASCQWHLVTFDVLGSSPLQGRILYSRGVP